MDTERTSNQALLFRLTNALKKNERLKSAQSSAIAAMKVARKISGSRVGAAKENNTTSALEVAKAAKDMKPKRQNRQALSPLHANLQQRVVEANRDEAEQDELHPLSSLRKRKSLSRQPPPALAIPESPWKSGTTGSSFKDVLLTPRKTKKSLDFISPPSSAEHAKAKEPTEDAVQTWVSPSPQRAKAVVSYTPDSATTDALASLFLTPSPIVERNGVALKENADIVVQSIVGESLGTQPESSHHHQQNPQQPHHPSAVQVIRSLKRALKKELRLKNEAVAGVHRMHEKITEMHSHVQVAFKMKKVAEDRFQAALEEREATEARNLQKVIDLQQTIQNMERGHQMQKIRSDKKILRLKKKAQDTQADISSLETHLHKYEHQINTLQAQIELLRRNMMASAQVHKVSYLSPAKRMVLDRIHGGLVTTPPSQQPSDPFVAHTPSILDALNIEMI